MISLRLVNVNDRYWYVKDFETIGMATKYLQKLKYSTRIKCIGMEDEYNTPLPYSILKAFREQLPDGDTMYEYDKYPMYITIKKGD